jgi:hypothetical protein
MEYGRLRGGRTVIRPLERIYDIIKNDPGLLKNNPFHFPRTWV